MSAAPSTPITFRVQHPYAGSTNASTNEHPLFELRHTPSPSPPRRALQPPINLEPPTTPPLSPFDELVSRQPEAQRPGNGQSPRERMKRTSLGRVHSLQDDAGPVDFEEEVTNVLWGAAAPNINLGGRGITCIPRKIADLRLFTSSLSERPPTPPASLSTTIPSITPPASPRISSPGNELHRFADTSPAPSFFSSVQTEAPIMGRRTSGGGRRLQDETLGLLLANNQISVLPSALFAVHDLVTLSLRFNQLEELPPAIAQLRNLRELNVSNNKLKYLPAEILTLDLKVFNHHPNPFYTFSAAPPDAAQPSAVLARPHTILLDPSFPPVTRFLSPLNRRGSRRVPALTELCLRSLLSPATEGPAKLVLSSLYDGSGPSEDPFQVGQYAQLIRAFRVSAEDLSWDGLPEDYADDASENAYFNRSPTLAAFRAFNPARASSSADGAPLRFEGGQFCDVAEERFEWVQKLPGKPRFGAWRTDAEGTVIAPGYAWVPVRWRSGQSGTLLLEDEE